MSKNMGPKDETIPRGRYITASSSREAVPLIINVDQDMPEEEWVMPTSDARLHLDNFTTQQVSRLRPRKWVRFPSGKRELERVRLIPKISQEDRGRIWYTQSEIDRMQYKESCVLSPNGCRRFLDNVYVATSARAKARQQQNLNCWCRYERGLRGMESDVNMRHCLWRLSQKDMHLKRILMAQDMGRKKMGKIELSVSLATISARSSLRSREFALAMGKADEYAQKASRGYRR